MSEELDKILEDTESLQIKGATSVANIVIDILVKSKNEITNRSESKDDFVAQIKNIAEKLAWAQPTETMAQNVLGFIIFELQDPKINDLEDCGQALDKLAHETKKTIEENEKKFIKNGLELIKLLEKRSRSLNVLTHCHSSGVRHILKAINDERVDFKVFNTETRPVFLGRTAARRMVDDNIDVTMIIDSAAPFIISNESGPEFNVDLVLLGADAITINGSVANKIGSYGISLSAFYEKIPIYIVASLLKIKRGVYNILDIPMEMRSCREVWENAPRGLNIVNLAFDIIPSEFITGFITEFGVIKPEEIKDTVRKNYPRLM